MNEFEIYKMAEKKVRKRLALEIHVLIFLLVNITLLIINVIFAPLFLWVIIVILSWGLGLVIHAITFFIKKGKVIALAIHTSSFIMVQIMLIYINLVFQPNFYWFVFPLFAFLTSLLVHGILYYIYSKEKEDKEDKNWYIKRIEKEAIKIKKEISEQE
ncbi:MAG: 2TM domain-containing protein [Candidatus Helarchaeota archaeon]